MEIKSLELNIKKLHAEDEGNLPLGIEEILSGEVDCDDNTTYVTNVEVEITGYTDGYNEYATIGTISGRLVDVNEMILNEECIEGYLDYEQPDINEVYLSVEDKSGIGNKNNIFSIDSIHIDPKYKDKKILSSVLILFERYIYLSLKKPIGAFVVNTKTAWHTEDDISKSIEFWSKLGFQHSEIQNTMYFNTDFDMREIYMSEKTPKIDYANIDILAFPKNKSIFNFYNNRRLSGISINIDMVSKEELFMMVYIDEKKDLDIAKIFGTTASKVKNLREKYLLTDENLEEKPTEINEIIINCINKFNI